MKNRKLLYLLVPLTLFLWGMIIYRILSRVNKDTEVTGILPLTGKYSPENQVEDTFTLVADYSDPFLERNLISSASNTGTNVRLNDAPKEYIQIQIPWPEIRYGGMILNKSTNNYLYLVEIDHINHLLKKGDQIGQIKIAKVFKDSITVQFKNHNKTIFKETL
jgi:hypothetical protein